MHSWLIFQHPVVFPKEGRLCEIPASYGYDVGGSGWSDREIRQTLTPWIIATSGQPGGGGRNMNQENLLGLSTIGPYRKPTQVDGCDYTQAYERNIVQELGKKVAVTSG